MTRGIAVARDYRNAGAYQSALGQSDSVFDDDENAIDVAAQALREAEIEATQPNRPAPDEVQLEQMSIDELRALAAKLDIPNRGAITERDRLIAALRARM
jgi:hypothetical protein